MAVLPVSSALAQQVPNAGNILRGIEETTPPPPQPKPETLTPLPQAEAHPVLGQGETVQVTAFHITATLFPENVLKTVVAPWVGKPCTLADLREAAAQIGRYYQEHGYVARAYLPQQSIQDGIITIAVLEGRMGLVVIDPSSQTRLDPDLVHQIILGRQAAGMPVRFDSVETGIATIAEQPGMQAAGTLEAGASEGLTDLRLKLDEGPRFSGLALVDNEAQRSLGTQRGLAMLSANDITGRADLETLTLMKSDGSSFARLDATVLALPTGLRVGVDATVLRYKVEPYFNTTTPDGWAYTGGMQASQPLWRGDQATFEGRFTYDHKYLVSRDADLITAVSNIDVVSLGVDGSAQDNFLGGGLTHLSLTATTGNLDLSADPANEALQRVTARTEGSYARFNASLSRNQPVAQQLEVVLRLNGQMATKNLDSSEQLSLGGPDGVRAFAVDEGFGSAGFLGTLELGWQAGPSLRLAAFWDGGLIHRYVNTWAGWQNGGNVPNTYGLEGPGVGAHWGITRWLLVDATAAAMVGGDPGRINGYDADGERRDVRAWIRATATF